MMLVVDTYLNQNSTKRICSCIRKIVCLMMGLKKYKKDVMSTLVFVILGIFSQIPNIKC